MVSLYMPAETSNKFSSLFFNKSKLANRIPIPGLQKCHQRFPISVNHQPSCNRVSCDGICNETFDQRMCSPQPSPF